MEFNDKEYSISVWSGERLGDILTVDTETTIAPFTETPDMVTFQVYGGGSTVYYVPRNKVQLFLNKHYESAFIMHNAPFDVDVIHKHLNNKCLYDHYDRCLIYDTGVMYRLLGLAVSGQVPFKYSLQFLVAKFLGITIEKDERRENFSQFIDTDIKDIPKEYLEYGAIDVVATHELYYKLGEYISRHDKYNTMLSQHIQVKGDLALNHIYKNGIGFDIEMRDKWLAEKDHEMKYIAMRLADWGLQRGVPGYKETFRYIVEDLLKLSVPYRYKKLLCNKREDGTWEYAESGRIEFKGKNLRVEEGQTCHADPSISSQREDLEDYYDTQPFVKDFLDYMETEKATSFVRDIESDIVHPRYSLLKNTGRTSCSKPNFQQLPKKDGVRQMFRAEEGKTFIITDYSAVELATLSQVLFKKFGQSIMRDKINEGIDLHKYYASVMHSIPVSQVTKQQRQEAKAANFGYPGGLGVKTFIQFSKGYGLNLDQQEAQRMKDVWFSAFPETVDYMKNDQGYVFTLTGRKRNNTTYCAEKNTPFQGLAADGAKLAMYELDKAGFKIRGFVHDEIITEVSEDRVEDLLKDQERIMIEGMRTVVPDVRISVESNLSKEYCK